MLFVQHTSPLPYGIREYASCEDPQYTMTCVDGRQMLSDARRALTEDQVREWYEVGFPSQTYSLDSKNSYVNNHGSRSGEPVCHACLVGDFVIMALRNLPVVHEHFDMRATRQVAEALYLAVGSSTMAEFTRDTLEQNHVCTWLAEDELGEDLMYELRWSGDENELDEHIHKAILDSAPRINLESVHQLTTRTRISEAWQRMHTEKL